MKYEPHNCEVCSAVDWLPLGRRGYHLNNIDRLDDYSKRRFLVLFDKWFPGKKTIEIEALCCNQCGFVMHSPRPEEEDIENKYRFLEELGQDYGEWSISPALERRRSQIIFNYLRRNQAVRRAKTVLDYGGGDGRLMACFLDSGLDCFLVDYNKNCIPGVHKLADTIADISAERVFDLIICSHVIEHVAQPNEVVKELSQHLSADGYLYLEVPMEIWQRPPLPIEPVTHINFFTPNSIWNLLVLAGLHPLRCELSSYLSADGRWLSAVRALAVRQNAIDRLDPEPLNPASFKPVDVRQYLQPGLISKLKYYRVNRDAFWHALKYRFTKK